MDLKARHHFDEFLRLLRTPVWKTGTSAEWHDETRQFVLEEHQAHLLFCVMVSVPQSDGDAALEVLYKRAMPQRFMGLPIRVFRNREKLIGVIALPQEAVTADRLLKLQHALVKMFDLTTF